MLKQLFTLMLKIGLIGFGGGSALIPIIHKEAVEEKKIISEGEFSKQVVIASITPGALPVELASGIGVNCAGSKGLVIAAMAMALPGCLLSFVFLALISVADKEITRIIEICSIGVNSLIIIILGEYVMNTIRCSQNDGRLAKTLIVILSIFILTSEKKIASLLGIIWTPIFGISTMDVFALVFFTAAFTRGKFNSLNWVIVIITSMLYILCVGKGAVIDNTYVKWGVELFMVLTGIICVIKSDFSRLKDYKTGDIINKEGILFLGLGIGIMVAGCVDFDLALTFALNGIMASLMSFGGGDAFLAIADAMFVTNGIIESNQFYGTIVPVVNVMPGSILCKTLVGIGYCVAYNMYENICYAAVFASLGLIAGVVGSCGVFYFILKIYEQIEDLPFLNVLRCWIKPIISGMLLTVAISLLSQNIKILESGAVNIIVVWLILILLLAIALYLCAIRRENRFISAILMSLLSVAISIV